jgi:hypothetical protein
VAILDTQSNSITVNNSVPRDLIGNTALPIQEERDKVLSAHQVTLDQLREKFCVCWVRGSEWRFEAGELLYQIKEKCEHGEWGAFLDEFSLARSTADDYIRRYLEAAEITVPRQIEEPGPDPYAEERQEQIQEEQEKRRGRKPTHHPSTLHVRVHGLKPYQMDLYREERKENRERVDAIWHRAFLEIVGVQEITEPALEVAEEEGAPCSA